MALAISSHTNPGMNTINPVVHPTVSCLLEEVSRLLDLSAVQNHQILKALLDRAFNRFSEQNGMQPLAPMEQRFYNTCGQLIDPQGSIRERNVSLLQEIVFEESSAAQAVHEALLFCGNKTYRISLAKQYTSQPPGWRVAVHGSLSKDRRDENSTYTMVAQNPTKGASWHIFSEDYGKTYTIALASNHLGQKGWFLGFFKDFPIDKRNTASYFTCIHHPNLKRYRWHFESSDAGKTYKIVIATTDQETRHWALCVHRNTEREIRDPQSTYLYIHTQGGGTEAYWNIEQE